MSLHHEVITTLAAAVRRLLARPTRVRLGGAVLLAALLVPSMAARAAAAYQNPFSQDSYYVGRTDMGVDLCLTPGAPITAVGDGIVIGVEHNWFEHQPFIWYELTDGPDAGRFVYVAEQINHLARAGQSLQAGDIVARYARRGTCIETGWSAADGETLAQATTGYHEGEVTPAGISFAHFLLSTGATGEYELVAPKARFTRHRPHARRRQARRVRL